MRASARTLRLKERIRHQLRGAGLATRARRGRTGINQPIAAQMRPMDSPGLVLIGTSTGGPAALDIVLPQLPPGFPWPVLVAQHHAGEFHRPFCQAARPAMRAEVVEVDRRCRCRQARSISAGATPT